MLERRLPLGPHAATACHAVVQQQARSLHPIQVMFAWLRAVVREDSVDVVAVVGEAAQVEA